MSWLIDRFRYWEIMIVQHLWYSSTAVSVLSASESWYRRRGGSPSWKRIPWSPPISTYTSNSHSDPSSSNLVSIWSLGMTYVPICTYKPLAHVSRARETCRDSGCLPMNLHNHLSTIIIRNYINICTLAKLNHSSAPPSSSSSNRESLSVPDSFPVPIWFPTE